MNRSFESLPLFSWGQHADRDLSKLEPHPTKHFLLRDAKDAKGLRGVSSN